MTDVHVPHTTVGAIFIGVGISSFFYGVTSLQASRYFRRYHGDPISLKLTVTIAWIIETVNSALAAHALFHYSILNRGKMEALSDITWCLYLPAGTNATSATFIQLFFAWRIYMLSRNIILTTTICALTTSQCSLGLATAIQGIRLQGAFSRSMFALIGTASFSATAVTDILITVSLCYYLHIRKTGYSRTNDLVNHLMILAINNGILSSTIALIALITNLTEPRSMISFACWFVLGKAYTNTLLSSLNARESFQNYEPLPHPLRESSDLRVKETSFVIPYERVGQYQ